MSLVIDNDIIECEGDLNVMITDRKIHNKYTKEEKERLTARLFPPENCSLAELTLETGISKSTLSTWKSKVLGGKTVRKGNFSSREKFIKVIETYTMSEAELSRYCREKGIYTENIKKWRVSCIDANGTETTDIKDLKLKLQDDKKKIRSLEKELSRKEKALAETATLLVLRKKLTAILGDREED